MTRLLALLLASALAGCPPGYWDPHGDGPHSGRYYPPAPADGGAR